MTDRDPKDMTASELLRMAVGDEEMGGWSGIVCKLAHLIGFSDLLITELGTGDLMCQCSKKLADKIDAEIAEARKEAVNESKKPMWWFRSAIKLGEDWPEPRDGEKFRDYLHRCFLPRPRFEDGEPVQSSDMEEIGAFATYRVYMDGSWEFEPDKYEDETSPKLWDVQFGAKSERVKRPAPEALGADGKPIKVGEKVYRTDAPITEAVVVDFRKYDDGSIDVVCSEKGGKVRAFYSPSLLTHTPPDTQQRIDEDKGKKGTEYWRCVGFLCGDCPAEIDGKRPSDRYGVLNCSIAQGMDIARRQADLDARKGGE